jgi:hypothetical protein
MKKGEVEYIKARLMQQGINEALDTCADCSCLNSMQPCEACLATVKEG